LYSNAVPGKRENKGASLKNRYQAISISLKYQTFLCRAYPSQWMGLPTYMESLSSKWGTISKGSESHGRKKASKDVQAD
jgi:hypothetical protein